MTCKCCYCFYWRGKIGRDDASGRCQIRPPVVLALAVGDTSAELNPNYYAETHWPTTEGSDWCGEWRSLAEDNPKESDDA
jgi:hypothetical protein